MNPCFVANRNEKSFYSTFWKFKELCNVSTIKSVFHRLTQPVGIIKQKESGANTTNAKFLVMAYLLLRFVLYSAVTCVFCQTYFPKSKIVTAEFHGGGHAQLFRNKTLILLMLLETSGCGIMCRFAPICQGYTIQQFSPSGKGIVSDF